jgi:hypothetical protein
MIYNSLKYLFLNRTINSCISKNMYNMNLYKKYCPFCNGVGQIFCFDCQYTHINCIKCLNKGKLICPFCNNKQ